MIISTQQIELRSIRIEQKSECVFNHLQYIYYYVGFPDWIDKGAQQISVVILHPVFLYPVDRFVTTTCEKKSHNNNLV